MGPLSDEVCDDGDACTADTCSAAAGCVNTPLSCDDGDSCTTDSCTADVGCQHLAVADGTLCGTFVACQGVGVCNADVCEQSPLPDGLPCSDDDLFTTGDVCEDGACVGAPITDALPVSPPTLLPFAYGAHFDDDRGLIYIGATTGLWVWAQHPSGPPTPLSHLDVGLPLRGRPLRHGDDLVLAPALDGTLIMIDTATPEAPVELARLDDNPPQMATFASAAGRAYRYSLQYSLEEIDLSAPLAPPTTRRHRRATSCSRSSSGSRW